MFRDGRVSEYVLERELSAFMGDLFHVRLSKEAKAQGPMSYSFFMVPERLVEGFKIVLFIDESAVMSFYNDTDIVETLVKLQANTQKILKKYAKFRNEDRDISLNYSVGFLLNLYMDYKHDLSMDPNAPFLPSDADVLKYSDLFSMENATRSDLETLLINKYICNDIIDFVKEKYVHPAYNSAIINVKFADSEKEVPAFNLGRQQVLPFCTSTFGIRHHEDIPYDYTPKR